MELTQELVRRLFDYKDGALYWKVRPWIKSHVKIGDFAGTINHLQSGDRYRIKINGKCFMRYRLIFLLHKGYLPKLIDHENHITTDDRIENLRAASHTQNQSNCTSHKGATSKYLGVHLCAGKYWRSAISIKKSNKSLGFFKSEIEAALAYNREAVRFHGEFANLNIIKPG